MRPLFLLLALCTSAPLSARAQSVPAGLAVETLAGSLSAPVALEFMPGGRALFAEQNTARVRVLDPGKGVQTVPVLEVPGVSTGGERGLLGLALDPVFPSKPYLYLYYTVASPAHVRIARYTLTGDLTGQGGIALVADPASRFDLVDDIPDNASNHNGGTLHFDPDGTLYASVGEDAVPCAAQDASSLRGVLLRLETHWLPPGPGAAFRAHITPASNPFVTSPDSNTRLVAAMGLRNPFRFQVDSGAGQLVIGDVGEGLREELDLLDVPSFVIFGQQDDGAAAAQLGANFGWPYLEGTALGAHRADCAPTPQGLTPPAFEYDRTQQLGGAAIVAAGIYRAVPGGVRNLPAEVSGDMFASDYYSGALYRLEQVNGVWAISPPVAGQPNAQHWGEGFNEVSDWRIGPDGAFWFCRQSVGFAPNTGSIGRIAGSGSPPPPPTPPLDLKLLGSPVVGLATFLISADRSLPGSLTLHDLSGRRVRSWTNEQFGRAPDGLRVSWDGRDADGNAARPGIYVARLESGGRTTNVRFPFLR